MKREYKRVVLINAPIDSRYKDSTALFCPPLGLMSIKAYLEQNNDQLEVILLDGMILTTDEILKKMHTFHPNIVGVSIQLLSYKNALQICREASDCGSLVFVGGHHATQMAVKIMKNRHNYIDCVICGDGEEATLQLCSGKNPSEIPGVICWDDSRNNIYSTPKKYCTLDILPNPYAAKNIDFSPYILNYKKSSFPQKTGKYYRIYSHKGCRFRNSGRKCVFCGRADEGYRFFSINRFFQNLSEMHISDNDFVFDVGDDLSGNVIWLRDAVSYIQNNAPTIPRLGIFGRGDEITPESAKLLHQLGVIDVTMGIETGDNGVLFNSGKNIKSAGIFYQAAQLLFERGIGITPSYVLGLPGENIRSLHNTVKHAHILKELSITHLGYPPGEIVANLLEPIPGSNAFALLENILPHKYLTADILELETMQRDYFCTVFSLNSSAYEHFRERLRDAGRTINNLAVFADPQGWLRDEL